MGKKTRSRVAAQREPLRHRILLHTGTTKTVGEAQWRHHIKIGNLTRKSNQENLKSLLAADPRLALVKPGLLAYENPFTSQLVFEAIRGRSFAVAIKTSLEMYLENWLKRGPGLPKRLAHQAMLQNHPRLEAGSFLNPFEFCRIW